MDLEAQRAADSAVARGLWEYGSRRGFRGPAMRLESEIDIARFLKTVADSLPTGTLLLDHLYRAVILEVGKDSLEVAVGPFEGSVAKKNLEWILPKGALSKQLQRGDFVWVRLDPEIEDGASDPLAAPETEKKASLKSIVASLAAEEGAEETGAEASAIGLSPETQTRHSFIL